MNTAEHRDQAVVDADIVCFDVFDTLLDRTFLRATDVFTLTRHRVNTGGEFWLDAGWTDARIAAEAACYCAPSIGPDITIDDIYDRLAQTLHMTDAMRAAVQQAEIATELSVLSATSRGRRLYELAREAGRRIFIISDMYLPPRRSPRLAAAGYDGWDRLVVSGHDKVAKHNGTAFRLIRAEFPEARIVHIGDNAFSDVEMARRAGFDAFHLPGGADQCDHGGPHSPVTHSHASRRERAAHAPRIRLEPDRRAHRARGGPFRARAGVGPRLRGSGTAARGLLAVAARERDSTRHRAVRVPRARGSPAPGGVQRALRRGRDPERLRVRVAADDQPGGHPLADTPERAGLPGRERGADPGDRALRDEVPPRPEPRAHRGRRPFRRAAVESPSSAPTRALGCGRCSAHSTRHRRGGRARAPPGNRLPRIRRAPPADDGGRQHRLAGQHPGVASAARQSRAQRDSTSASTGPRRRSTPPGCTASSTGASTPRPSGIASASFRASR